MLGGERTAWWLSYLRPDRRSPKMFWLLLVIQSIFASLFFQSAWGYIPAAPANTTLGGTGLDTHDNSSLTVTWKDNGLYGTGISYQLKGSGSVGISKVRNARSEQSLMIPDERSPRFQGALLRIQESDIVNNDTSMSSQNSVGGGIY